MPRSSKLSIIVGGSVLCVATMASVTAVTCPVQAAAASTARPAPVAGLASAPQGRPPALSDSLFAASLSAAPMSAFETAAGLAAHYRARQAAATREAMTRAAGVDDAFTLADIHAAAGAIQARFALRAWQAAVSATAAQAAAAAAAAARAQADRAAAARAERLHAAAKRAEAARAAAAQAEAAKAASARAQAAAVARRAAQRATAPQGTSAFYGSPREIAEHMLDAAGQPGQFSCLDSLWEKESGWNIYAQNPGSGAYGIPQALPGGKMATAGSNWRSSAATQIAWGLSYISSTYGSACAAWAHEEASGWY